MLAAVPGCSVDRAETAKKAQQQMVGLTKEGVLACMGRPAQRDPTAKGEIWRYPSGGGDVSDPLPQSTYGNAGTMGSATSLAVATGQSAEPRRRCGRCRASSARRPSGVARAERLQRLSHTAGEEPCVLTFKIAALSKRRGCRYTRPPMAFFANNAVNLLNLHYAISALAMTGGGAFFLAYLIEEGISVAGALAALTLMLAGRFILRPLVLPAAIRWGLRAMVMAGTLIGALQYPVLAEVHGLGAMLILLCLLAGAGDAVYWSTYHAYFASLGDHESRGRQLGAREAIAAMLGIVSPLATGWALVDLGPRWAFGASFIFQVLAAVPLIWTPDIAIAPSRPGAFKAAAPGMLMMLANGWMAAGLTFVWRIALFVTLGENFLAYGGALAAAALAGAVGGLVLGHHVDTGRGARALWVASTVLVSAILLRALAPGHAGLAVAANALGAVVVGLYIPTMMTPLYNLAKRSPCALRFHIATEGAWDVGCAGGCLAAALLIHAGVPLSGGILLALLGAGSNIVLLRRYYRANQPATRLSVADT
jgi:hypothetical protein